MNTLSWHLPKPTGHAPRLGDLMTASLTLALLELGVVLGFLVCSVHSGDWSWFPRGGATVAAIAEADLFLRALLRGRWRLQPLAAAVGCLVWGFGDLVG